MQVQPVNMVNDFCWKQVSPQLLLQHQSMLKHQASLPRMRVVFWCRYKGVTIKVNDPAGAKTVV